jgi:hypothetical protein
MRIIRILLSCFLMLSFSPLCARVTLDYNDGYQLFGTVLPTSVLNRECRELLKQEGNGINERFFFSTAMYGQKATTARNLKKETSYIGDVHGRLNMVGLLYGTLPQGVIQPSLLQTAAQQTFQNAPLLGTSIANPTYSDLTQNFGFFTDPGKYHKVGLRFQASVRPFQDLIFTVQAGIADLQQTTNLVGMTLLSTYSTVYPANSPTTTSTPPGTLPAGFALDQTNVEQYLMEPAQQIFQQLGVTVGDIQQTGAEDVSFYAILRHNFPVNQDSDPEEWAYFIFTPILQIGATAAAAKAASPYKLYDLSLGNNRHQSLNVAAGFSLDFAETLELDFFTGITHFFSRTYLARVPTSQLQSTLFPYTTNIISKPGQSWFISLGINAYHLIDNLSVYAQYLYMAHLKDKISLVTPDPAFIPSRLEQDSPFKIQVANFGFDYDLSPNFAIGLGYQLPLARRGAYKANTVLLNLTLTF